MPLNCVDFFFEFLILSFLNNIFSYLYFFIIKCFYVFFFFYLFVLIKSNESYKRPYDMDLLIYGVVG